MDQEQSSARETISLGQCQMKTRKSSTKVRTGCLTCKSRRVKCDEAQPSCLRCLKFGVVCEGYKSATPIRPQKTSRRVILPKDIGTSRTTQRLEPVKISPLRNGAGFDNELDGQCFRIYLEDTAGQISGPFQSALWRRLIPQISEMEPFVRHAVIAIGALSKQGKSPAPFRAPGSGWQADQYQYALTQYAKSVRGMREAIANGHHDLQKALVACLLVFCFEGMLGNQASASLHAESGLMLLHQWSSTKNPSSTPWLTQKAWKDQVFEGDLLEAFAALDSQVLIFMDHRTAALHQHSKLSLTRLIQTMPPVFYNLDLARQFWKLIINRNYHFSKQIQAITIQKAQEAKLDDPWEGSAQMDKEELLLSNSVTESSSLKDEHLRYQDDIEHWRSACSDLFAEIEASPSQREQVGAAILQVQTRMSQMMLAGIFFNTETEYDIFVREFVEIVNLSETILSWILSSHKGSNPYFYFDVGIVPALFFVASRCREDATRKRAMDMLFSANYREGIWDALAVAHIAKWLRGIELEDVASGENIPEKKRAVLSAVNIDLFNKRALIAAAQGLKGAGVQRKTMLVW